MDGSYPRVAIGTDRGSAPKITVCVPHWQVRDMMSICLRSIRKYSDRYNLDVLVVDNGSRDGSLDWLRGLSWIRLVERPEETSANWPANVFTAWDYAARNSDADFLLTMHSDVFVRREGWLDPFLREFANHPEIAATGAWKLNLESPLYALQKQWFGDALAAVKQVFGRSTRGDSEAGRYPRDYCAMYRRELLVRHDLSFLPRAGEITGGYPIARRLREQGYDMRVFPVAEMARNIVHVTHGSAALTSKELRHRAAQGKAERRAARLFAEPWVRELREDARLDAA
jgi:GT2 family glycosyltransferase